jgi:cyclohexanone monooxygenase
MRWIVRTDRGDVMKARFVITANGSANRAKLPGIPGIRDFEGHSFHTNRWDYAYTGGDHSGNLHKLADKRVAIIGTGATAIQCVPHVGAHAKHLYAFQRTPSSVDWRGNKPTDPEWAASLKPGWQRERRENFDDILFGRPVEVDLIQDGWTQIFRDIGFWAAGRSTAASDLDKLALMNELADFKLMNRVRTRIEETVRDPATAEALKPWFRMLCKRPCFNDEYLPTFNRPNVTLVDTSDSLGVERITNKGVVVAGVEYQVDCIIYATGFELGTAPRRRYSFDITGKDGVSLFDHWRDGLRSLHGHSVHGFPNWFYIGLGQVGASANMTSMFDEQAKHVAYIIAEARQRGARTIETTAAAEQAWVDEIHSLSTADAKKFLQECTPGYYNNEGKPGQPGSLPAELYTPGLNPFNALLGEWRAKGTLDGLELRS